MIQPQSVQDVYLNILEAKEKEADHNLKESFKKYQQDKQIKAAATRERIAWEKGMGK